MDVNHEQAEADGREAASQDASSDARFCQRVIDYLVGKKFNLSIYAGQGIPPEAYLYQLVEEFRGVHSLVVDRIWWTLTREIESAISMNEVGEILFSSHEVERLKRDLKIHRLGQRRSALPNDVRYCMAFARGYNGTYVSAFMIH